MTAWRSLAAALLVLTLVPVAHRAHAHASLVSSEPADGAALDAAPRELVLHFDEPVAPITTRLVADSGRPVPLGPARVDGPALRVTLPQALSAGTYLFSYRVTSADSHPIGGSIAFAVGVAATDARGTLANTAAASLGLASIALRALRDAALLTTAGAALFVLCVASFPRQRRMLLATGLIAAVASLLSIGVQGALLLGTSNLLTWPAWTTALRTSFGLSALMAASACAIVAWTSTRDSGRTASLLMLLGALGAVASLVMTGHAAAAQPRWLGAAAIGAHGLAAAFWLGSLVALLAMLRHDPARAAPALRRFSRIAIAGVALLLLAGIGFAALQLSSLAALTQSQYGRLILLKAGLVALMLLLAAANRFVLMPRLASDVKGVAVKLRRAITAEIVILLAVLMVTAVLVQTSPHAGPISKALDANGSRAILSVDPGRAGRNVITVALTDAQGRALQPAAVEIEVSNPTAGIEPMRRRMQAMTPGQYRHEGSELAFAGAWTVEIRARIDDFEQLQWSTQLDLR